MDLEKIKNELISSDWDDINVLDLPDYNLYKGIKTYFSYKNKLTIHIHPVEKIIRLMIYGDYNGNEEFPAAFIKIVENNNVMCLELEYDKKIDNVIKKIIEIQDDLNIENYFTHYFGFQSVCPVSILAVEQYLPGYR